MNRPSRMPVVSVSRAELGEVWRRHFGRRYPAMALIGVSALFEPDARVELMGVAVLDG